MRERGDAQRLLHVRLRMVSKKFGAQASSRTKSSQTHRGDRSSGHVRCLFHRHSQPLHEHECLTLAIRKGQNGGFDATARDEATAVAVERWLVRKPPRAGQP